MLKHLSSLLLLIFSLLACTALYAEEGKETELKPQIGSMDDTGRVDPDKFKFSNAENKLWMDSHLLNIAEPTRLHYEFKKGGSYEEGFIDDVYLDVVKFNEDGSRDTVVDFFSAERKQAATPSNVSSVTGNPVIGMYLQGDIYEMQRLTSGHWRYFLRQIKLAMADSNESTPVTVELNGQEYASEKIVIWPFENIKNKDRLGKFSKKRYEFIMSDDIPGKLYQIHSLVINQDDPSADPLIAETLTLKSVNIAQ